ncbi:uncharacterized protein N7446_004112 [Penicillium canescens]|uniref:Uncharacterized protein n=1 Tax=Penicillium canescens TaxID=5083 RepID=A0AAD6I1S2_PENCN|nr:uncharacterized protein N7446_004112 [Penicillium canescens]KAJ6027290.1 hypothetical protein N7460_012107 [Penicillium canescens]KAJ6040573.1 hypothetical protein N7444_009478 [Penicillium canescens]KAJ6067075.1 hypothetical protein N7446_004112 [Penicillium canescens]
MPVHSILRTFILVASLASLTPAASFDHTQTFKDLQDLRTRIDSINSCLETYDGGTLKSLTCAKDLYGLMVTSTSTRSYYESSGPFSDEQLPEFFDNYHAMRTSIQKTLRAATSKLGINVRPQSSQLDSAGFNLFAHSIIQTFSIQRGVFEKLTKIKVPLANHSMIAGPVDSLDAEFQNALSGFARGIGSILGSI